MRESSCETMTKITIKNKCINEYCNARVTGNKIGITKHEPMYMTTMMRVLFFFSFFMTPQNLFCGDLVI